MDELVKYLLIDKGKYYQIKLNYPPNTTEHEYKYKTNGLWKAYNDEDGFILVKPEYESELVVGGKIVKIEVSPGNYVDFTGDWYIFDSDFSNISGDIFMRWVDEGTDIKRFPIQIVPLQTGTVSQANIVIIYPQNALQRQYKINGGAYGNYSQMLTITQNGTVITARAQYRDGN
ncbi:hypothetical protein D3C73_1105580 [compost metagenome]